MDVFLSILAALMFFCMDLAWCLVSSMLVGFWHASAMCCLFWQGFWCKFEAFSGVILVPRVLSWHYCCPGFLWWGCFCMQILHDFQCIFNSYSVGFFVRPVYLVFFGMHPPCAIIGHFDVVFKLPTCLAFFFSV